MQTFRRSSSLLKDPTSLLRSPYNIRVLCMGKSSSGESWLTAVLVSKLSIMINYGAFVLTTRLFLYCVFSFHEKTHIEKYMKCVFMILTVFVYFYSGILFCHSVCKDLINFITSVLQQNIWY